MKFRTWVATFAVTAFTLTGGGIAAAHGPNHPTPSGDAAARAEAGLLAACKGAGWTALFTPIDLPFQAPADDTRTTNVNENDADAFTFGSREQCKKAVRAGAPVGLLARHAGDTNFITVPAPAEFPDLPRNTPPALGADVTTEGFQDGADNFQFTVRGARFEPGQEVTLIVNTADDRPKVVRVGNAAADGTFTYVLRGTCHPSQRVVSLTGFQMTNNLADSTTAPAGLCVV